MEGIKYDIGFLGAEQKSWKGSASVTLHKIHSPKETPVKPQPKRVGSVLWKYAQCKHEATQDGHSILKTLKNLEFDKKANNLENLEYEDIIEK